MKLNRLLFGTAGIPVSTIKPNTERGIARVRELGLQAYELEFVRSINISPEKAPRINQAAKKANILLTCHAPYYINLNAKEKEKRLSSIGRIVNSARITKLCGGWSVCFHAGYYMEKEKQAVYKKIKESIKNIVKKLKEESNRIWIRPEISGKPSQFGSLQEVLQLSAELDQVLPCIDFSHLHARTGANNSPKEFQAILETIEKQLGKHALNNMHIHISGIAYGKKGEKHHLNLQDSDLKYRELIKVLKQFRVKGVVISESPNLEKDALLLQKIYKEV